MPSLETSPDSALFGKDERNYLWKVVVAMQNPVRSSTVRMWLTKAQAEGLDPRRIYEAAVEIRPPHWMPAPPFSEVAPK